MKNFWKFLLIPIILVVLTAPAFPAQAADPVVRAVLFYSPSCGHCHYVITEVLPPIMEKYKESFEMVAIDVTTEGGQALYQEAIRSFSVPDDRLGVPTMIVGDVVLVGSGEIPTELEGLIDNGLAAGGVEWPAVPALLQAIEQYEATQGQTQTTNQPPAAQSTEIPERVSSGLQEQIPSMPGTFTLEGMQAAFLNDPLANSIAIVVLLGMLTSLVLVALRYLNGPDQPAPWLSAKWLIPLLALIGLAVSAYLSYGEVFGGTLVCGPVGQCDAVQESQYAKLFGVLHVGVLGMVGYLTILLAWTAEQWGPKGVRMPASLAIWGMAWFGVLFSSYLTFLEPFVIGATCMWCITQAIIITAILWISNEKARLLLNEGDDLESLVEA